MSHDRFSPLRQATAGTLSAVDGFKTPLGNTRAHAIPAPTKMIAETVKATM
jgi:hypothetical protein